MRKYIYLVIIEFIFFETNLYTQNIVLNGDFEEHNELDKYNHNSRYNFSSLRNWNNISWQTYYCNCKIGKTDHDWFLQNCNFDKYKAQSGCGMVKIIYEEACPNDDDWDNLGKRKLKGCTGYLKTKLSNPLEIGDVYHVSMWVYLVKDTNMEPSLPTHIGFTLSNKDIRMPKNNMLDLNSYFSDTIVAGQWYQISKYIRPQCKLNYLIMGIFRDQDFPKLSRTNSPYYFYTFFDNVSINKINEDTLNNKINITPHCRDLEKEVREYVQPVLNKEVVYFKSGDATLDETSIMLLDSTFQTLSNKSIRTYKIVGHTDNIGHENCELSIKRAKSVRSYLLKSQKLNEYNLLFFGKCEKDSVFSNKTEINRSKNRRVEISETSLTLTNSLYRHGLYYNNIGDFNKSREYFLKWLNIAPKKEWICILFDTRIQNKYNNQVDKLIYSAIRKKYYKLYKNEQSFILDSMYFEDQKFRTLDQYLGGITGFLKGLDTFNFNSLIISDSSIFIRNSKNMEFVYKYLKENPLPKISKYGYRSAMSIPLLINHSGDTAIIKKYLPLLKANCEEGEGDWLWYAQLMDIYLLKRNELQIYGTQYLFVDTNKLDVKLAPSLPVSQININRKNIALPALIE